MLLQHDDQNKRMIARQWSNQGAWLMAEFTDLALEPRIVEMGMTGARLRAVGEWMLKEAVKRDKLKRKEEVTP